MFSSALLSSIPHVTAFQAIYLGSALELNVYKALFKVSDGMRLACMQDSVCHFGRCVKRYSSWNIKLSATASIAAKVADLGILTASEPLTCIWTEGGKVTWKLYALLTAALQAVSYWNCDLEMQIYMASLPHRCAVLQMRGAEHCISELLEDAGANATSAIFTLLKQLPVRFCGLLSCSKWLLSLRWFSHADHLRQGETHAVKFCWKAGREI